MKISIFGLGFIGSVTSVCLAELGNQIYATDINKDLLKTLQDAGNPFNEDGFSTMARKHIDAKNLVYTNDKEYLIKETQCTYIVVDTPSRPDGTVNLDSLSACVAEVVDLIREHKPYEEHLIIIKSTVPVGTIAELEDMYVSDNPASGKILFAMEPDFTRETTAVMDFLKAEVIVFGSNNPEANWYVKEIYRERAERITLLESGAAEMIKYTNNAFHALKIAFANEIGRVGDRYGVNAQDVMDVLCQDKKLNISKAYLKPGFAFGGSCLPKDLKGLKNIGASVDLELPLVAAMLESNKKHISFHCQKIIDAKITQVGFYGIGFKAKVFDLRESPIIYLISELIEQDIDVKIYEPNIEEMLAVRSNLRFLERNLPNWESLLVTTEDILFKSTQRVYDQMTIKTAPSVTNRATETILM